MPDLTEFLYARITEDEQVARHAGGESWEADGDEAVGVPHPSSDMWQQTIVDYDSAWPGQITHIARWDPARVLAESEAKRHIVQVAMFTGPKEFTDTMAGVLQLLAQPYSDHPDFDASWRVE